MSPARPKVVYVCSQCGYESPRWLGKCPGCGAWNTLTEQVEYKTPGPVHVKRWASSVAMPLADVSLAASSLTPSGLGEFDRVLGGGVVPGSVVLVSGDPGIGKSTLLLQVGIAMASAGHRVLYVTGEESAAQVRARAERLGPMPRELWLLAETDLEAIIAQIKEVSPELVVIDSIQTTFWADLPAAPGSVGQLRECAGRLLAVAKTGGPGIFLVGHVTKSGEIAGPKVLEHIVDTVLYLEGERHYSYRVLRAYKNRFGSTNEIGIFEMTGGGLREVANPSEVFLSDRRPGATGTAVAASIEGTRPILVEVQALVAPAGFGTPRRVATGMDYNRLAPVIAVLEKRLGMSLANQDVYVKVAGGVYLDEPATDLAMAIAIASSYREKPVDPGLVLVGEVGLGGEVRAVSRLEPRLAEAARLAFQAAVMPAANYHRLYDSPPIELRPVNSVEEAIIASLGG